MKARAAAMSGALHCRCEMAAVSCWHVLVDSLIVLLVTRNRPALCCLMDALYSGLLVSSRLRASERYTCTLHAVIRNNDPAVWA